MHHRLDAARAACAAAALLAAGAFAAPHAHDCPDAASAAHAPCPPASAASPAHGGAMLTRQAHEERMRRMHSFKSWEECRAYVDDPANAMPMGGPRAASRPGHPMGDPCASLPRLKP